MPLAHVFVASPKIAKQNDGGETLSDSEVLRWSNLTSVDFASFFDHIHGAGSCGEFELVAKDKSNEFFTEVFPQNYAAFLASLESADIKRHCKSYAKSDENQFGPDAKTWVELITKIKDLAIKAQEKSSRIYLWNCV